jgi:hypothetical protein
MGHTFKGFFTKDESVAKSAKDKWPFCQLKGKPPAKDTLFKSI